jgi:hypothetical protein
MKIFGIPEKIKLTGEMYRGYACKVEDEGGISDLFESKARVTHGFLLSQILFVMVLDIIMTTVVMKDKRGRGIQWNLLNKLEDLDYADDVCLTAPTLQAMKTKLQDLAEAKVAGLQINIQKTKETRVNAVNKERVCVCIMSR